MNTPAIVFEDNHIMVVIKPQNVPTQEDKSGDLDMLNMLKKHRAEKENKKGEAFVGLVHRLDRVTGGVMVFAKTSKAASRLSEQMRDGEFAKKYVTVLAGCPKERRDTLEHYLLKNERTNKVEIVGAAVDGAKRAELSYNVKSISGDLSLAEVTLVTGRSHQIRVQMQNLGTPIWGDAKYGNGVGNGLALWAYELSFNHPTSGDRLKFVVNPPEIAPWTEFDFDRKSHKTR